MATRVAGEDEGNGEGGKSSSNGSIEGNCEEEDNGRQRQQQDNGDRDNENDQDNNSNKFNDDDDNADDDDKDKNKYNNNNSAAAVAGGVAGSSRGETKASAAGVERSYFFIKTESWVLLVVGEGQGRQAGSLKYPPRKVHVCRKLVLLLWAKKIAETPNVSPYKKSPQGHLA